MPRLFQIKSVPYALEKFTGSHKDDKVMENIRDFIDMEGYGGYVWPSYLATAIIMIILLIASYRLLKANMATLKALENTAKEDLE